jgi:hypothetical protein
MKILLQASSCKGSYIYLSQKGNMAIPYLSSYRDLIGTCWRDGGSILDKKSFTCQCRGRNPVS